MHIITTHPPYVPLKPRPPSPLPAFYPTDYHYRLNHPDSPLDTEAGDIVVEGSLLPLVRHVIHQRLRSTGVRNRRTTDLCCCRITPAGEVLGRNFLMAYEVRMTLLVHVVVCDEVVSPTVPLMCFFLLSAVSPPPLEPYSTSNPWSSTTRPSPGCCRFSAMKFPKGMNNARRDKTTVIAEFLASFSGRIYTCYRLQTTT